MKLKLKDKFPFGKYKDKTLNEVIETNPSYVQWCLDNVNDFSLDKDVIQKVKDNVDRKRSK